MKLNEITVTKINVEKLNEEIDSFLKESGDEVDKPYVYRILARDLCFAKSKKGTMGVFDTELCGVIVKEDTVEFEALREYDDGSTDMFPVKGVGFSTDEMDKFIDGTTNVEAFMGKRFNYNTRIESNQKGFINFINTK